MDIGKQRVTYPPGLCKCLRGHEIRGIVKYINSFGCYKGYDGEISDHPYPEGTRHIEEKKNLGIFYSE